MKTFRLAIALTAVLLFSVFESVPVQAQSCQDFASRQIRLSEKQLERNNFSGALRVLDVALQNDCNVASIRDQVAAVLNTWYEFTARNGSTSDLQSFIGVVRNQSGLRSEDRSELQTRIRGGIESRITSSSQSQDYRETYQLCRSFDAYSDRTFTLNYVCGRAALEVQALNAAIARYEWMLDNWTNSQSYLSRSDAFEVLKELYLITTRFDEGFEVAKRLAQQDAAPENLLASVTAVRGRYLEPIARVAQVLFDGNPPSAARSHVAGEMQTVKFPPFVESVYLMTADGSPTAAFYGESEAAAPGASLLQRDAGDVSLLLSDGDPARAWLITEVDDGYFVVQFDQQTEPEENVILEGLLENVNEEKRWERLYEYEFTATYPATGSAVATLLGGAYLADVSLRPYESVFSAVPVLEYFCIQNAQGGIEDSYAFSRNQIQYEDGVWTRSSETPALFHHTVQRGDNSLREVVWPTYDGDTWSGVVRIGISRN